MRRTLLLVLFLLALTSHSAHAACGDGGLIGYWPLDGDAADASGCGNDGTVTGAVPAADALGNPAGALSFDGIDDIVGLGTSATLKPSLPVTVSVLVNHSCPNGVNCWIFENDANLTQYSGFSFLISTTNVLYAQVGDGGSPSSFSRRSAVAPVTIPSSAWVHLALVVRSPTDFEYFIDGVRVDPDTIVYDGTGSGLVYLGQQAQIGFGAGSFTDPFVGEMDEVRFYDRALSQSEIVALDPRVAAANTSPLVASGTQKISDTDGFLSSPGTPGANPGGLLADGDRFGSATAPLGDVDGDGVEDLAVGALFDADGGALSGSVYLLLLNADGTVKARTKLSATSGGLDTALATAGLSLTGSQFGAAVTSLGDLDGPGGSDFALAVGAFEDDGGGSARGAVYVLFMDASPLQVASLVKIGDASGGFPSAVLDDDDFFGSGLAAVGDLDGDGRTELAVGAAGDDDGGSLAGAVYVLFLGANGELASPPVKLATPAAVGAQWGSGIAALGPFDGDALPDLAVSAPLDRGSTGSIWLVPLNADGTAKGSAVELSVATSAVLDRHLESGDRLGLGLATLPDLDGDGRVELLAGASRDDDGHPDAGAAYVLHPTPAGTLTVVDKLSERWNCLGDVLAPSDLAGIGVAPIGDLDGDGTHEVALGVLLDDDGGSNRGAVQVVSLERPMVTSLSALCVTLDYELGVNRAPSESIALRQGVSPITGLVASPDVLTLPASVLGTTMGTIQSPFLSLPSTGAGDVAYTLALGNLTIGPTGPSSAVAVPTGVPASPCTVAWPGDTFGRIDGGGHRGLGAVLGNVQIEVLGIFDLSFAQSVPGVSTATNCGRLGGVENRIAGLPWTDRTATVFYRTGTAGFGDAPNASATRRGLHARAPGGAGHLSVVTPIVLQSNVNEDFPSFARVNVTLVPEPVTAVTLVAGALVLLVLAARRR
ncbi:MAG: LamG-like jellyroll fold domain-containing protein [Myxococcota bacterium]